MWVSNVRLCSGHSYNTDLLDCESPRSCAPNRTRARQLDSTRRGAAYSTQTDPNAESSI
jgi:hypothetical protein